MGTYAFQPILAQHEADGQRGLPPSLTTSFDCTTFNDATALQPGFISLTNPSWTGNMNQDLILTGTNGIITATTWGSGDQVTKLRDRGVGPLVPIGHEDVLRDFIHEGGDGAEVTVEVTGLVAGLHSFRTYHHDWNTWTNNTQYFSIHADDADGTDVLKVANGHYSDQMVPYMGETFILRSNGVDPVRFMVRPNTGSSVAMFNGMTITGPCTESVTMELRADAQSSQASWEIVLQSTEEVVCQFNIPSDNITGPITETCCLPVGCYRLRVMDSGGDGFVSGGITGGYQLRESGVNGRRIIDNLGNFTGGSVSAIANTYENGAFCVPLGDDKPIFSSCDKLDWVNNKFLVCHSNPAVSAQYGVANTTSGYEFWFFDPNGTYSFRRFRNHATSDGYGSGATRACHFKVNGWVNSMATPHLPANRLLNVRVRGRVAGNNLAFGPACLFKIDPALAACPRVKLQDDPANTADFSCGVSRDFGGPSRPANRIYADPPRPVPVVPSNLVRYQFRFRIPGENICIVRPPQTSARMVLNWSNGVPLECSKTYEVDVRVSLDGGATWCFGPAQTNEASACADTEAWGKVCLVTINGCLELAEAGSHISMQGSGGITLYPNPNHGDQLFLSMDRVPTEVDQVSLEIFDLAGKNRLTRSIAAQDGWVKSHIDLGGELGSGLYLVRITVGSAKYSERLVIAP